MKSKNQDKEEFDQSGIFAAEWSVKIARGLSPSEQDAYTEWLMANRENGQALRESQWAWDELDRLAGLQPCSSGRIDPDLLHPKQEAASSGYLSKLVVGLGIGLPTLLLLALALYMGDRSLSAQKKRVEPALELMTRIEQRVLDDGSKVELNRTAAIEVAFTDTIRRVHLLQGEVNFAVQKDPLRPFVVTANGIDFWAVGTEFSVKLSDRVLDVLVTEGKVMVPRQRSESSQDQLESETILTVGQLGRIGLDTNEAEIKVSDLSAMELERRNLWRPRLLDYDDTPLREIVAEFNRSNPIQVLLADPELGDLHLSSSFWSDNVEGFVRLLSSSFGIQAEWRSSREIILSQNKGPEFL
jgi:transmembrane sensor